MPIMFGARRADWVPAEYRGIPWAIIAPHGDQAERNHWQTLEHLAYRGGLSPCEAVAILEDRKWRRMDQREAFERVQELCAGGAGRD